MVFSDTTNKTGIIQAIEFRTNIGDGNITGDLLKQFTAQINLAYMNATRIIMEADGTWKWDDSAHTDFPNSKSSLSSGVDNYLIMSSAPEVSKDWLSVERVEIKDDAGNWINLINKDLRKELTAVGNSIDSTPSYYDFDGTSIRLKPAPSYSSTNGLKLWFKRAPLLFSATGDDSKRPGFASHLHEYLVLLPTYYWEKYKSVGNPEQTKRDIQEIKRDMAKHYGKRDKTNPRMVSRASKLYI